MNSPFFNINFKDGGFGLINTGGVEFGGRVTLSKSSNLGLHMQAGLARVISVNPEFENILMKGSEIPSTMISVGVGFSW